MIRIPLVLLMTLSLIHLAGADRPRESFQHFFSDIEVEFKRVIAHHCSDVLRKYQDERIMLYGVYCVKTYSCILSNITEYTKANMASATVLLGLTPTILATLGSSTTELSLLSSHRSVLAFFLVLGSPAINPIRTFDYPNPIARLQKKKWRWHFANDKPRWTRSRRGNAVRVMLQLIFALGSIANLADLCRTIALNTISVMSCDWSDILIEMWIGLALITHWGGMVTFSRRYKVLYPGSWWWRLRHEMTPCFTHTSHELTVRNLESRSFIVWSFITSVYTIVHLGAGTLIFSALSFVGNIDATMIVGRFMCSAIMCRLVVAYELAGMTAAEEMRMKNLYKATSAEYSEYEQYFMNIV